MIRSIFLAAVAVAPLAWAETNLVVMHQGYLLDGSDNAVDSPAVTMQFRIFELDSPVGTETPIWTSAACQVPVQHGFYAVALGGACGPALPSSVIAVTSPRHLDITVEASHLLPRLRIGQVPVAALALEAAHAAQADTATLAATATEATHAATATTADTATSAASATNAANAAKLENKTLAEITTDFDGRYAAATGASYVALQPGAGGSAQAGHVAITGSVTAASFTGSGAAITGVNAATLGGSSLLQLDTRYVLATGNGATFGANAADRTTINAGAITSTGTITAAAFAGSGAAVTGVDATKVGGATLAQILATFTGVTRVCAGGTETWSGTAWGPCQASANGSTPALAASSCAAIKAIPGFSGSSGTYFLDPDGVGPGAYFQAFCDMDTDGGGWTLLLKLTGGISKTGAEYASAVWTGTSETGTIPTNLAGLATASVYGSKAVSQFPIQQFLIRDETVAGSRGTRRTKWATLKTAYNNQTLAQWTAASVFQGNKLCDHANRADSNSADNRWVAFEENQTNYSGSLAHIALFVNTGNNSLAQARLVAYACQQGNLVEFSGFGSSRGCNFSGVTQGGFSQYRDAGFDTSAVVAGESCSRAGMADTVWSFWAK